MSPKRKKTEQRNDHKPESVGEGRSDSTARIEELRERVEAGRRLVERMTISGVPMQPGGRELFDQARMRYEQAMHAACDRLADAFAESEEQNERLRKDNRELERERDDLKYRNAKLRLELRQAMGVKSAKGDADANSEDNPRASNDTGRGEDGDGTDKGENKGRRGAPKGHRGATRPIPDTVDREEVVPPPQACPCGCSEITPLTDFDERWIEDIPPVCREVLRRIYLHGRCRNCGGTVRHPDALSSPPVTIGPNLTAHLTVMNQTGVTFRKLAAFSTETLGIALTPAGALGLVERSAASLQPPYNNIARHLRQCDWLNGDETGWRVAGRRGYIWCFCNQSVVYFHHDFSRGAAVIEDILGEDFPGVVVCDFYAAYNCIDSTQRCLVHLLREIKKEREILSGSKLLEDFEKSVREFIERGLDVPLLTGTDPPPQA